MNTDIILSPTPGLQPEALYTPTPKAAQRVLEFFTAQINNDHTRRAYMNATRRFAAWCASKSIEVPAAVQPFHVAAFIKDLQAEVAPPTVKQHLAALRMLFDWLVTGHRHRRQPGPCRARPEIRREKAKRRSLPTTQSCARFPVTA
jgi:integrase/recombinase XerD